MRGLEQWKNARQENNDPNAERMALEALQTIKMRNAGGLSHMDATESDRSIDYDARTI